MTYDLATVIGIYQGSDGEATKALYAHLKTLGPAGKLALNLFRACKASERAKLYRGGGRRGSYRSQAYEKKEWSISNLARALHVEHAQVLYAIRWGWGVDTVLRDRGDPHHHVLYVELPTGQVSFHTGVRVEGPDYPGQWDGVKGHTANRICTWIATLGAPTERAL